MIHRHHGPHSTGLTSPLQRFFFKLGHESAARMPEDTPMVTYMRDQIAAVLADNAEHDEAAQAEIVASWGAGFEHGIVERVNSWKSVEDALAQLRTGGKVINIDSRQSRRVSGTLHRYAAQSNQAHDEDDDKSGGHHD